MNPAIEALFIGPTFMVALLIFANFNRANHKANRWLGAFIFLIFIIQLEVLFDNIHIFGKNSPIDDVFNLANYVIAPVFYFGIIYYVEPNRKWKGRDNLHFLFGMLMFLLTVLSFFIPTTPAETPEEKSLEATTLLIFTAVFCLQVLAYCFAAFYRLVRYQKQLLIYASNTGKISLHWLKKIIVCVMLIAVLWLADLLFQISENSPAFDFASTLLYFIGICYIAYHALQQKELFPFKSHEKIQLDTIIDETGTAPETKKKLITDQKLAEHVILLQQLMDAEKPYLDYELSLIRLAELSNTSPHLLSYIINAGFGDNFFQFINKYRVEEAKRLILDPKMNHLSLVGIAYEAGFNSKTVFNTTFKKITGQTPTGFKKNHN